MTALIIEDEPLVLAVFQRVLQKASWTALASETAEAALRYCQDRYLLLDLIIVDRQLPDESGSSVALKIKAIRPDVHFLFTSGTRIEWWAITDLRNVEALPKDSYNFLQKPFTAQKLMDSVEGLLNRKSVLAMAAAG